MRRSSHSQYIINPHNGISHHDGAHRRHQTVLGVNFMRLLTVRQQFVSDAQQQ